MSDWSELAAELDAWHRKGRRASFWWRDDDAADDSPALAQLLGLVARFGAPLAIAAIPARTTESLTRVLLREHLVSIVQHGYAHIDHSLPGQKKVELTAARPLSQTESELRAGRDRLAALFGAAFRPILVPPWNRIAPAVAARLPALAYSGLSAFGVSRAPGLPPGFAQLNCHLDLFRWKPERAFLGEEILLGEIIAGLRTRRQAGAGDSTPLGVMTHHLVHGPESWRFLERLLEEITAHPVARLLAVDEAFAASTDSGNRIHQTGGST